MRAKYIYENLDFQRGKDPKMTLGLGPSPDNQKAFINWVISKIPEMIGKEEIPKNIISNTNQYINDPYVYQISKYLNDVLPEEWFWNSEAISEDSMYKVLYWKDLDYDFYLELGRALYRLGYPRDVVNDDDITRGNKKIHEDFQRGRDPKKTLDIGIRPENRDLFSKYIAYRIPEILGTKEIPEDIIDDPIGSFVHGKYVIPISSYIQKILDDKEIPYTIAPSNVVDTRDDLEYNIWEELHEVLRNAGYPTWD